METHSDIATLLAWYEAMGVDALVADEPVRLRREVSIPQVAATKAASANPPVVGGSAARTSQQAVSDATRLAAECDSLEDLEQAIMQFDGCALKKTAISTVFADGHAQAPLMVMGEAPGADEDRQGKPFVGRSGALLDRMLSAIGLHRGSEEAGTAAYISNMIPWRPPGNRQPSGSEIALCLPFALRHIAIKRPKVLLLVGGTSAKSLLDTDQGIMRLRGRWHELKINGLPDPIPLMPTFHPAYLLRQPGQKRQVWADLLALKAKLSGE